MDRVKVQNIVRAIIQASLKPVSLEDLCLFFGGNKEIETADIQEIIEILLKAGDPVQELKSIAGGYRYQIKPEYSSWVQRFQNPEEKDDPLPKALVETLGIIAYKQPVSRGEVDFLRGKQTSVLVYQDLEERGWIKIVAYGGESKRAALYGTTKGFLEYFGLNSIEDLPNLEENVLIGAISL